MKTTIDMAREAGFNFDDMLYTVRGNHDQLAHLEALIRADERALAAKEQGPSPGGVLFAVEQAVKNGDCPWEIENAFDAYEIERMEKNNG